MSEDFSDLAAVIDELGHDVTLTSSAAGTLGADGFWTNGSETTQTVTAVSWPSNGRETEQLPAGERTKELRTFATRTAVTEADATSGRAADRFTENGREYKVMKLAPWSMISNGTNFYVAICVRVGA